MKDKAWTLGVLLVAVLLVVLLTSAQQSDMGRYQTIDDVGLREAWKIDTTTGRLGIARAAMIRSGVSKEKTSRYTVNKRASALGFLLQLSKGDDT